MIYERKAVTRMTLDMSRVDLQRSETVTLLDTNRRWEVTLTNGGTPFRLPSNWPVSLVGVKPDGNGLMLRCSVVDGRIVFDFAENKQLTTCEGAFAVQFDVWDEYGELVASPKIWLYVLTDARPHEDLKSTGQYTTIGDLMAKEGANRTDIDEINALLYGYREGEPAEGEEPGDVMASVKAVDQKVETNKTNITDNAAAIAADAKKISTNTQNLTALTSQVNNEVERLDGEVERLDERIDNLPQAGGGISVGRGEFTIPVSDWEDDYPDRAKVVFPAETFVVGDVVVVTPANDETREAANSAGLFIRMAMSGDYESFDDQIMLARTTTGLKPTEDMQFVYAVLHTDSDANALVTLIGVDAAGSPAPTSVDLSAFDPDENGKGYITETYGEGEDAPKKVTEVTYDEAGNIIKIGNTAINWGGEA